MDWDQNCLGKAQAEERTTVDVCPDSPSKDPPPSLPKMEVVVDPQQTDDQCGQDSEGLREFELPRGTLCIGTLCCVELDKRGR